MDSTGTASAAPPPRTDRGRAPGRARPWRVLALVAAGAVAVQALFLLLLVGAQAVPNSVVLDRLVTAVEAGDYGPAHVPDGFGGIHDKFTECAVLGYGVDDERDGFDLLRRTVYAPRLTSCPEGAAEIQALARGEQVDVPPYYRYWSGYAVVTRPALALFGVPGLRLVVAGLLAASAAFAVVAVQRTLGGAVAAALLVPVVASSHVMTTPGQAFTHGISLAAIAVGTGAVALATRRYGWVGAAVSSALAAALFNYVDLLTTPAMAWALAAFVAGAVAHRSGRGMRAVLATVVAAGAAWPVAFAVTWVSRWIIAVLFFGPGVLGSIREVSSFRISGEFGTEVSGRLGAATGVNVAWWWDHHATAPAVVAVAAVAGVAALVVAAVRSGWRGPAVAALLAAPALTVPLWYEILSNHSQIHEPFTYRSVPTAVAVVLAATLVAAGTRTSPRTGDRA